MKKIFIVSLLLCFTFISCKQNNTRIEINKPITGDQNIQTNSNPEIDYIWGLDKMAEKLEKKSQITNPENNPQILLDKFNETHNTSFKTQNEDGTEKELTLKTELLRTEKNYIYLIVQNSSVLSQTMGSAGAQGYIASLSYTMTELEGIDRIHLKLSDGDGDHATAGYYTRDSFNYNSGK